MTKQPSASGSSPGQINMIAEGTVFEGTVRAAGDVRVSGRVVGALHVDGKVIVTQEGAVEGELRSTNADVAGGVQGEINVADRLILRNTAHVDADVKTSRLVMEEGAIFGGKCRMGEGRTVLPDAEKPSGSSSGSTAPGTGAPAEGLQRGGGKGTGETKEAPRTTASPR